MSVTLRNGTCTLSRFCADAKRAASVETYRKLGRNVFHSSIVRTHPGVNEFSVNMEAFFEPDRTGFRKPARNPTTIRVVLPAEHERTSGIIFSDPCVSSRWLVCEFATGHREALQMTVDLTNRILADDRVHFMYMLGDNFYDLDGTETTRVWSALSLSAQAKVLGVVPLVERFDIEP